jgi:hypothetical protein
MDENKLVGILSLSDVSRTVTLLMSVAPGSGKSTAEPLADGQRGTWLLGVLAGTDAPTFRTASDAKPVGRCEERDRRPRWWAFVG